MRDLLGRNLSRDLDNHITGHYGEDQFKSVKIKSKMKKSTSEELRDFVGRGELQNLVEKSSLPEKAQEMLIIAVMRYVKM